jgi:hypothetical protein
VNEHLIRPDEAKFLGQADCLAGAVLEKLRPLNFDFHAQPV